MLRMELKMKHGVAAVKDIERKKNLNIISPIKGLHF